jgi:hypothetical protein
LSDRIPLDDMTSDQLDQLYRERDEARQHAAAIAAQRDRLRQRMNTLADRWDLEGPPPGNRPLTELRAEISVAPFDPDGAMTVQEYTEHGRHLWAFRCWGTDTCDGWLGLGHHTQTSALLERERHVTEEHTEHTAEARLAHLQATSEAAGRLLARESDRASQTEQRLLDMTLNRDQLQATLNRVRAATDQLHRAVLNIDGEPLSLYDRGVDTAVRRIREALDEAGVPGNTPKED